MGIATVSVFSLSWRYYFVRGQGDYVPNERGEYGLENVRQTLRIIKHTQPRVWFIENSRNILRHLMPALMEEVGVKGVHKTVLLFVWL